VVALAQGRHGLDRLQPPARVGFADGQREAEVGVDVALRLSFVVEADGHLDPDVAQGTVAVMQPSAHRPGDYREHGVVDNGVALNRAIHTIATVRMRDCPATQAYIARRTVEARRSARSNAVSSATSRASSTAASPPA
jgi:hypothetical protein